MRNCGSLPQHPLLSSSSNPLFLPPPTPPQPTSTQLQSYSTSSWYFRCLTFSFLHPVSYLCSSLSSTYFSPSFLLHYIALCPILNKPTIFNPPNPILLHSLPIKSLSLLGRNEWVLNMKSPVQMLTRTGHPRCCSSQAGHFSAQAGTPLVLQKRGAWDIYLIIDRYIIDIYLYL